MEKSRKNKTGALIRQTKYMQGNSLRVQVFNEKENVPGEKIAEELF